MTLLERLQAHRGGLLRIKSKLFWYDGRGWDGVPGRVCLVLDAAARAAAALDASGDSGDAATGAACAATLLLVDGQPHWVRVAEGDVEVINETG